MKSILDNSFQYTASFQTDLRKKFAQIRRQMRKDQQPTEADTAKVFPIKKQRVGEIRQE
jgi:hypothetical protein